MCLRNGSEWTDEKRMNDALVDSVVEYQEYCEVPHMALSNIAMIINTQKSRQSHGRDTYHDTKEEDV